MLLSRTEQIAYCVRPLDASTWDAFAEVVERNNGVFGGCWCMGFHPERFQMYRAGYAENRVTKEAKVREGQRTQPPSWTTTGSLRDGASTAAPKNFRPSSTGANTKRTRHRCRTDGSPASTSTKSIAGRASRGLPSSARSSRSPQRVEVS